MSISDQQLLELAANAAGIGPVLCYEAARNCLRIGDRKSYNLWRPKQDDGDSFRLACALHIGIDHSNVLDETSWVTAERWGHASKQHPVVITEPVDDESHRAQVTRDVVLRAAD